MKLLSVEQARVAWFFPLASTNPTGRYIMPLLSAMVDRYKFADIPNVAEAIKNNKGLIFGQGAFNHPTLGEIALDVAMYTDAIFADTRTNSDASEAFLNDLFSWTEQQFGIKKPDNIRRQFISRIFFESTKKLNSLNSRLRQFAELLTTKSQRYGNVSYEASGLSFSAEQVGPIIPAMFRFERAENVPLSENRYYSFAGLPTADHLELLDKLEEILQ